MPTRNVVLTDHQAQLIEELVSSGQYQNASEVLRDGLRLIESRNADEKARLEGLRKAVLTGLDDIETGRSKLFEDLNSLKSHLQSKGRAAIHKEG